MQSYVSALPTELTYRAVCSQVSSVGRALTYDCMQNAIRKDSHSGLWARLRRQDHHRAGPSQKYESEHAESTVCKSGKLPVGATWITYGGKVLENGRLLSVRARRAGSQHPSVDQHRKSRSYSPAMAANAPSKAHSYFFLSAAFEHAADQEARICSKAWRDVGGEVPFVCVWMRNLHRLQRTLEKLTAIQYLSRLTPQHLA